MCWPCWNWPARGSWNRRASRWRQRSRSSASNEWSVVGGQWSVETRFTRGRSQDMSERGCFVTLSGAKSLVSFGNKTEILRCPQNDKYAVGEGDGSPLLTTDH